jgi:peptidoglycan/xylan/chitin deacetylase (PgdA/CDA1 family)
VSALDSVLDMHASTFAEQMRFLVKHYNVIDWREWEAREAFARPSVVLTFDDGFRNNADVVAPILCNLRLPAIFFVSTRHARPDRPLWFRHLQLIEHFFPGRSLRCGDRHFDLSPPARAASMIALREFLLRLRPHPEAMYAALDLLPAPDALIKAAEHADRFEGLREVDIAELGREKLFTVGVHTEDHPWLTYCTPEETARQLATNQDFLRAASGQPCEIAAYPGGDYDSETMDTVRRVGLRTAFAVDVRVGADPRYEIPRFGIYRQSLFDLATKVQWGTMIRRLGKNIG